jgi:hypothetical protein
MMGRAVLYAENPKSTKQDDSDSWRHCTRLTLLLCVAVQQVGWEVVVLGKTQTTARC